MEFLSDNDLDVKVHWPTPKSKAEEDDISTKMAQLVMLIDSGELLKELIKRAVVENANATNKPQIAETTLSVVDRYEAEAAEIDEHIERTVRKDRVVVPAYRTLEP